MFVIVCRDIDTPEDVYVFEHPSDRPQEFVDFAKQVTLWVGHNFVQYDRPALLANIPGLEIDTEACLDTLVVSHLLNHNIVGGHSLEAWADRIKKISLDSPENFWYNTESQAAGITGGITSGLATGLADVEPLTNPLINPSVKKTYGNTLGLSQTSDTKVKIKDFSVYTAEILHRCVSDTLINYGLFRDQQKYVSHPAFARALKIEHKAAYLCSVLHQTGFAIDINGTRELYAEVSDLLNVLSKEIQEAFPPRRVVTGTITARGTNAGGVHSTDFRRLVALGYGPESIRPSQVYDVWKTEVFNPGSHKQVVERLNEAGWKPTDKTDGHKEATDRRGVRPAPDTLRAYQTYGWRLSEDNLKTLPDTAPDGARKLTEWLMLRNRVLVLEQWLELARQGSDGGWRIHGRFTPIGAWTGRMSHSEPNMANVPKAKPKDRPTRLDLLADQLNDRLRSLWIASSGRKLIGVDADGIQMRVFAHYVNDERLTNALISGKKSDKSDIHSLHQRALGAVCRSRDAAKTFIYAWLLGAGAGKVAEILECSVSEAKDAIARFIEFYPGLAELKRAQIPADATRGYFVGLDGRYVVCDDEHLMLAGYLQNGESVIMKYAMSRWYDALLAEQLRDWGFVNFVHDEWQTEAAPELVDHIGDLQCMAIVWAGESLSLRCPLAGTRTYGMNWKETH